MHGVNFQDGSQTENTNNEIQKLLDINIIIVQYEFLKPFVDSCFSQPLTAIQIVTCFYDVYTIEHYIMHSDFGRANHSGQRPVDSLL